MTSYNYLEITNLFNSGLRISGKLYIFDKDGTVIIDGSEFSVPGGSRGWRLSKRL